MILLNALEKSFEVALMFARAFMLLSLERSVLDVYAAVFAPILGLYSWLVYCQSSDQRASMSINVDSPSTSNDLPSLHVSEQPVAHK